MPAYRSNLIQLNKELGTEFNSWNEIQLNSSYIKDELAEHWENYVRHQLNIHFVKVLPEAGYNYKDFLSER